MIHSISFLKWKLSCCCFLIPYIFFPTMRGEEAQVAKCVVHSGTTMWDRNADFSICPQLILAFIPPFILWYLLQQHCVCCHLPPSTLPWTWLMVKVTKSDPKGKLLRGEWNRRSCRRRSHCIFGSSTPLDLLLWAWQEQSARGCHWDCCSAQGHQGKRRAENWNFRTGF